MTAYAPCALRHGRTMAAGHRNERSDLLLRALLRGRCPCARAVRGVR
ncbi:hypothetical protein ACFPRL_29725 [Pseudoclavibacter helvolus]